MALLEGDDYWIDPLKLQKQLDLMDSNPRLSMCGTAVRCVQMDSDGSEIELPSPFRHRVPKPEFGIEDFLGGYPMHSSTIFLRRNLSESPAWIGQAFNTDVCVFALQTQHGPAGYLTDVTSTYRLHQGGVWASKTPYERHRSFQRTSDLLNQHFAGRYIRQLRQWEHADAQAALNTLIEHRAYLQAAMLFTSSALRVLPYSKVFLQFRYGLRVAGSRATAPLRKLRMSLGLRTRLRRVFSNQQH
jgi:hypothetical protein